VGKVRCILGSSARGVRVALSGVLYSVDRLLTATIKIPIQQYAEMLSRGGWNNFELMVSIQGICTAGRTLH